MLLCYSSTSFSPVRHRTTHRWRFMLGNCYSGISGDRSAMHAEIPTPHQNCSFIVPPTTSTDLNAAQSTYLLSSSVDWFSTSDLKPFGAALRRWTRLTLHNVRLSVSMQLHLAPDTAVAQSRIATSQSRAFDHTSIRSRNQWFIAFSPTRTSARLVQSDAKAAIIVELSSGYCIHYEWAVEVGPMILSRIHYLGIQPAHPSSNLIHHGHPIRLPRNYGEPSRSEAEVIFNTSQKRRLNYSPINLDSTFALCKIPQPQQNSSDLKVGPIVKLDRQLTLSKSDALQAIGTCHCELHSLPIAETIGRVVESQWGVYGCLASRSDFARLNLLPAPVPFKLNQGRNYRSSLRSGLWSKSQVLYLRHPNHASFLEFRFSRLESKKAETTFNNTTTMAGRFRFNSRAPLQASNTRHFILEELFDTVYSMLRYKIPVEHKLNSHFPPKFFSFSFLNTTTFDHSVGEFQKASGISAHLRTVEHTAYRVPANRLKSSGMSPFSHAFQFLSHAFQFLSHAFQVQPNTLFHRKKPPEGNVRPDLHCNESESSRPCSLLWLWHREAAAQRRPPLTCLAATMQTRWFVLPERASTSVQDSRILRIRRAEPPTPTLHDSRHLSLDQFDSALLVSRLGLRTKPTRQIDMSDSTRLATKQSALLDASASPETCIGVFPPPAGPRCNSAQPPGADWHCFQFTERMSVLLPGRLGERFAPNGGIGQGAGVGESRAASGALALMRARHCCAIPSSVLHAPRLDSARAMSCTRRTSD
ncbi:hypothetical protein C8R43DRAFT_1116626 [Mycena crocata]|nr:hypothetical protein C8R43DRAFT_1116626 [Mycena crocata]